MVPPPVMMFQRLRVEAPMTLRAIVNGVAVKIAGDGVDRALTAGAGVKVLRMLGARASFTEASAHRASHAKPHEGRWREYARKSRDA